MNAVVWMTSTANDQKELNKAITEGREQRNESPEDR
jgi:hypothetical protein